MKYLLPDGNTIVATDEFISQHHPGATLIIDPTPEPQPIPVNLVCSPAQGIVALFAVKQITEADVNAAIAGITDPIEKYKAHVSFTRTTEWRRDSAAMQGLAILLGLTEVDLDELFNFATTVQL